MRRLRTTCLRAGALPLVAAFAFAAPAAAQQRTAPSAAEAEVIAVMDRLFDAMRAQDTATIRRISHPELRLFVPGEQNGAPVLRVNTLDEFIRSIAASTQRLDERAFDPEVRIDGNLASIWTYYEFLRGTEFSHCGVDAFHFARMPDGWKIVGLAYTVRRDGCRGR